MTHADRPDNYIFNGMFTITVSIWREDISALQVYLSETPCRREFH